MNPAEKSLLILDIDETLVFATEHPLPSMNPDFRAGQYAVYRRPFVSEFLSQVSGWYELAVWSSASGSYVFEIVKNLFGDIERLKFIWSAERCTRRYDAETQEHFFTKDLGKVRRLGYSLDQMLIIDDSPEKVSRHYGNHIRVKPFLGDQADTELRDLLPFLERLRNCENVRAVEKRLWREYAAQNHASAKPSGDGPMQ
jgi:RNA polymerase II subunit A small phosphatase-like protein